MEDVKLCKTNDGLAQGYTDFRKHAINVPDNSRYIIPIE